MKKILFLIDSLNGGGAEKVLLDIIDNLDKSLFDITLMTVWDRGVYVDIAKTKYKYKTIFKQNTKKNFINKFKKYYF